MHTVWLMNTFQIIIIRCKKCFGPKKHNMTWPSVRQKIRKLECHKITEMHRCYFVALMLTYFCLKKSPVQFFLIWNNCCKFLVFYGINLESVHKQIFEKPDCGVSFCIRNIILIMKIIKLWFFCAWYNFIKSNKSFSFLVSLSFWIIFIFLYYTVFW